MAHFVAFCIGFQKNIPLQNPPGGRGVYGSSRSITDEGPVPEMRILPILLINPIQNGVYILVKVSFHITTPNRVKMEQKNSNTPPPPSF